MLCFCEYGLLGTLSALAAKHDDPKPGQRALTGLKEND
jgi:hypothetical protein